MPNIISVSFTYSHIFATNAIKIVATIYPLNDIMWTLPVLCTAFVSRHMDLTELWPEV